MDFHSSRDKLVRKLRLKRSGDTLAIPQTLPEKLLWLYIVCNIPIYYLGLQFVLAPLLAYFLTAYLALKWWDQDEDTLPQDRIRFSSAVWVWIMSVAVIAIALLVGSLNFELSIGGIFISFINRWLRTWALFALFPIVGHLNIRPQVIFRAACILCMQMLVLLCIFSITTLLHVEDIVYYSPFYFLGGGITYYTVHVVGVVKDVDSMRLVMNAPWSPALGLLGNILFLLCYQEKKNLFRITGIICTVALIIGSESRVAILCLPFVFSISLLINKIFKSYFLFAAAILSFLFSVFCEQILIFGNDFITRVTELRQASSDTRDKLAQMALQDWINDAFVWGHGTFTEQGPALVHYISVGSHHTWYGLLYLHGIVGALAFAIAIIWSFWSLLIKIGVSQYAPLGISLLSILTFFSFAENIETLAYLYWPALVVLGIVFNETDTLRKV